MLVTTRTLLYDYGSYLCPLDLCTEYLARCESASVFPNIISSERRVGAELGIPLDRGSYCKITLSGNAISTCSPNGVAQAGCF
jgi:hypothetical protein